MKIYRKAADRSIRVANLATEEHLLLAAYAGLTAYVLSGHLYFGLLNVSRVNTFERPLTFRRSYKQRVAQNRLARSPVTTLNVERSVGTEQERRRQGGRVRFTLGHP